MRQPVKIAFVAKEEAITAAQSEYSAVEERANVITHALGIVFGIAGMSALVVLTVRVGDAWSVISSSIYGTTLVMLFLASTLYHAFSGTKIKHVLKVLDHSAIYLLIAGTYTVFTLVALRGAWGWSLFGVIWGLALLGIVFKVLFVKRFKLLSVAIYLLMGWLVIVAMPPLANALPRGALLWLVIGGLIYTTGVILYLSKRIPFNHAIWHLFVLAGSASHYIAVLYCVLP